MRFIKNGYGLSISLIAFAILCLFPVITQAAPFKVLVVMSYDNSFFWNKDIKDGIDSILGDKCKLSYVYLDTWRSKDNLEKGHAKAKETYELYQKLQPDGVIASDDNAQSMFVVPYLKDKVKTPIIFCGVNEDIQTYGYPTPNITGVIEVAHFRESIAFVQQLVPSIKTVGFMMLDRSTGQGFLQQFNKEKDSYPAKSAGFRLVQTLKDATAVIDDFKLRCDALLIDNMEGLPDENGNPLKEKDAIKLLTERFGKPTFCSNTKDVEYGVLCSVVKLGKEQGILGAEMLLKAMQGTPVSQIPVTRNKTGKRMLNVTVLKAMGINPKPEMLIHTEIVRTE